MSYAFTKRDLVQLDQRGISRDRATSYLETFARGLPYSVLDRACTVGDGITVVHPTELDRYVGLSEEAARSGRLSKFVPASGAATRMFQSLLVVQASAPKPGAGLEELKDTPEYTSLKEFLADIRRFAFFPELRARMKAEGLDVATLADGGIYPEILSCLLTGQGLDYGGLPKALIKFHRYGDCGRTAMEEHLVEAGAYVTDRTGKSRVHFTVAEEHLEVAARHLAKVRADYEDGDLRYDVTFSVQKPSTDTLAADMTNDPFREQDGAMFFRPGGHGALLENLDDLEGDIVLVKNIDNVQPDHLKRPTILYKKILSGLLVELQSQLFDYVRRLENERPNEVLLDDAMHFALTRLSLIPDASDPAMNAAEKACFLRQQMNRPLRVCGMVRSSGEPGGGPFWVRAADGSVSLQIVEASEVDGRQTSQEEIFRSATYFNPVDLVCGVRDATGKPFDLSKYSDPERGFISIKSRRGQPLQALEHPGLWNGGMAHWNTVFVEVPEATFSPVKTVLDLLRGEHSSE